MSVVLGHGQCPVAISIFFEIPCFLLPAVFEYTAV